MLSGKDVAVHAQPDKVLYHTTNERNQHRDEAPYAKNLLWMVFAGSRGGQNRIKIILSLKRSPLNAHQLAKMLGLNYRAIQHHISVLEKNNLVSHVGEKYGTIYFLSNFLEINIKVFDNIVSSLHGERGR